MRKSIIAVAALIVGIAFAANVYAASRVPNPDMYNNSREYVDSVCPEGKLIGFSYIDFKNDSVDSVAAYCERSNGSTFIAKPADWPAISRAERSQRCNKHEKLVGVRYKDRGVRGSHKDAIDGLSIACKNKRTGEVRWTYNPDTIGGRNWTEIWVPKGKRLKGISYKDGGCGKVSSDCVDAITLYVR